MKRMEATRFTIDQALDELDRSAPGVPLLALGQTVLWDEPMKACAALKASERPNKRRFVAGVHDTDYFAKLPQSKGKNGAYIAMPHNGTSTRAIWSAAAEFSTLFGSETVISKHDLAHAGVRLESILRNKPKFLDEVTEAYGWRGLVSLEDDTPIVNEVPLLKVFEPLQKTLDWAIENTLECLTDKGGRATQEAVDRFWTLVCKAYEDEEKGSITDFYASMLRDVYEFCAGRPVELETTRTSEMLRFNRETCGRPRFALVDMFLRPETAKACRDAYDLALQGTEIYGLGRFGTGTIPFDLVVPGHGRGTLRIGRRGLVVSTPKPLFASFKRPIESIEDLAAVIESKFGANCSLIGKAVTLIGMLSTEFVFVFHAGASSYIPLTQAFHAEMSRLGMGLAWNPILRLEYPTWDAIGVSQQWIKLPKPFQAAFGAEEICAPSFASRWRVVAAEQRVLLSQLSELRRPIELIQFLDSHLGGAWNALAQEYSQTADALTSVLEQLDRVREERRLQYAEIGKAIRCRLEAESKSARHFREFVFEQDPSEADLHRRKELATELEAASRRLSDARARAKSLLREQAAVTSTPVVQALRDRRRNIELEAEIQRAKLVRSAIVSSSSLERAARRPSAWWFPIVSPDGSWWNRTVEGAKCWFDSLNGSVAHR